MRKILILAFILSVLPVCASAQAAAGYSNYYKKGGAASAAYLTKSQLAYVRDIAHLLKRNDFTFIQRRDASHWIGISSGKDGVLLYIHDETARFNCRARINMKTGQLIILKGVDYKGLDARKDADRTGELSVAYFKKAVGEKTVFNTGGSIAHESVPVIEEKKAPAAHAEAPRETLKETAKETPKEKLNEQVKLLLDGNKRYVKGAFQHPHQSAARRAETAKGQHPFAVIVSCSDSRVPPEVIFDQGVGSLFVIRTAGESLDSTGIGSIEYAVEHLHTPLILVLGHERCGAVDAAVKGGEAPGDIKKIVEMIQPAVEKAKTMKGDLLENAIRVNTDMAAEKIEHSAIVKELVESGKLKIVKGYYDLDDGTMKIQE